MLLWPIFGDWVGATKMRSCCSMLWICKISKSYELEIWPSLPWTSGNLQKLEKFFDWSIFAVSKFVFKSFFLPCFAVFPCAFAKSAMFSFETKGMKDAVKLKMHEAKKRTLVSKARRDFKVWKSESCRGCSTRCFGHTNFNLPGRLSGQAASLELNLVQSGSTPRC